MKNHAAWALAFALAHGPLGAMAADCSSSTGYVISSPRDADGISSCSTFKGSISIQFADNPSAWSSDAGADLGDITTILGNLTIYPSARHKSTNVAASKLENIDGGITIWNTDFSSSVESIEISFPSLRTVENDYAVTGGIRKITFEQSDQVSAKQQFRVWSSDVEQFSIPGLTSVEAEAGVDSNAELEELDLSDLATVGSSLRIQTNAKLSKVNLENLKQVGGDLRFYQNEALTDLQLPSLEFADTISITSNGPKPSVSMPKLSSLGKSNNTEESTFSDVETVSFPQLSQVNGGLAFLSTNLVELVIPALKSLNGSITAKKNDGLESLALPRLETMRDVFIEANSRLSNFTANALTQAGTISIKGNNITNVEFFGLKRVTGDFKVSGADSMDCTWFDEHVKPIVNGAFVCYGSYEKPAEERKPSTGGIENVPVDPQDGSKTEASNSPTEHGKSGLSTGAKAGIAVGVIIIAALAALLAFFLLRRKRQGHRIEDESISSMKMTEVDTDSSSAEVYAGMGPLKLGVETKIEATPAEKEEKRHSLLNFRLSTGMGKPLKEPVA